ncbi:50S ribosomal protein L3 [Candidatus Mesenet endosymbiont of Phosphuga atrata]|uniref:50S ribosomal protein L3 n=1 Tax=Candidatus Mesenet endosymbiont of Phosphuga atrata TaxID=3066221 RepID=UPI0030CEECBF
MNRIRSLNRVGLLMKNIGHTALPFLGKLIPVTLLQLEDTVIVDLKSEKCGYFAAILGVGNVKNISYPQLRFLRKNNIYNNYKLFESKLISLSNVEIGLKFSVDHFAVNQYVDITGYSKGKGFAGVMKRHNFKGLRASHGVSIAHRSQGSTGQCQDPGKTFKGKKMAGHLGVKRVTVQNMKIVLIDNEASIIAVKGNNVPGYCNSYIFIRDASKKVMHENLLLE